MANMAKIIANCSQWTSYINHKFVQNLTAASLTKTQFKKYLKQDTIYLFHYAKIFALLSTKTDIVSDFYFVIKQIKNIEQELVSLYQNYYPNVNDENVSLAPACQNYIDYLYQVANNSTFLECLISLLPCAIGYSFIGQKLAPIIINNPHHQYYDWINDYSGTEFQNNVLELVNFTNSKIKNLGDDNINLLQTIFNESTKLEINFFNIGVQ